MQLFIFASVIKWLMLVRAVLRIYVCQWYIYRGWPSAPIQMVYLDRNGYINNKNVNKSNVVSTCVAVCKLLLSTICNSL